ncbi:MAG: ABC transporter permease subunit [Planctomycetota bacterium]
MRLPLLSSIAFAVLFAGLPLLAVFAEALGGLGAFADILHTENDRAAFAASLELGVVATAIAVLCGGGHAWLTFRTDLPGARWLLPLGVLPLVIPPILLAMSLADLLPMKGFWPCAALIGVTTAPFVAVFAARGLRAVDGREYEAALLARGRGAAERLLLRTVAPEFAAGALLAFLFAVSEHGVPEFLTVKGKTWHTYAEVVFRLWSRRATGVTSADLASPIVASLPLLVLLALALFLALRLRARAGVQAAQPLPLRPLGGLRWPLLGAPLLYLGHGVLLPIVVMSRWAAGSTAAAPMSLATFRSSLARALSQAGSDLGHTLFIAVATTAVVLVVALPLARRAGRGRGFIDYVGVLPLAVPAVLLAIGVVQVFNSRLLNRVYTLGFDFYDSDACVVAAYAARFLPFAILTLSSAVRRIPQALDDAAVLSGRGPLARALRVHLPPLLPAAWSATCLVFVLALRELDLAVVLPAGNGTVVRRLSNVVHFGGEDVGGALALYLLLTALLVPVLGMILTGRRPTPIS